MEAIAKKQQNIQIPIQLLTLRWEQPRWMALIPNPTKYEIRSNIFAVHRDVFDSYCSFVFSNIVMNLLIF